MKFLCIACDQAMRLSGTAGPDEGSLTVTFACPSCGHRVAMLTNPWETQMVRTLGVKVGGAPAEAPAPFSAVRASLAHQRDAGPVSAAMPAPPTESLAASRYRRARRGRTGLSLRGDDRRHRDQPGGARSPGRSTPRGASSAFRSSSARWPGRRSSGSRRSAATRP